MLWSTGAGANPYWGSQADMVILLFGILVKHLSSVKPEQEFQQPKKGKPVPGKCKSTQMQLTECISAASELVTLWFKKFKFLPESCILMMWQIS